ncbi:MAG: hypothetical protein K5660_09385 [Paludibacteraceae bacterium]|nr:hypothetical protein [Paludibacteraceae bacterium]
MRTRFFPLILLFASVFQTSFLYAQDAQIFDSRDYVGTARYTAMAGAMAAVGADPSAVLDNPAGLALYRRLGVSLTLHEQLDYTRQRGDKDSEFKSSFMLPNANFVLAFENRNDEAALRFNNFMFSFNRLHTFNRTSLGHADNQPTIANVMLDQVCNDDGSPRIKYADFVGDNAYDDPDIGWLSKLGFETYMIDPYDIASNGDTIWDTWTSYYDIVPANAVKIYEKGGLDEFNIHWAGLFTHHWSLGLGLNIRSLSYSKTSVYEEAFSADNKNYMQANTYLTMSGVGVSGTVGLLYQPVRPVRIGISFQTPVGMNLTSRTDADMKVKDSPIDAYHQTLIYRYSTRLTQPLRATAGMAFIAGQQGLVSLQYDYRHSRLTHDMHTMKIGGELVIHNNLFLNCGYAFESAFQRNEQPTLLADNDVRTDAEYRTTGLSHIAGLGIGFRNQHFIAQLAYRFRYQDFQIYPFVSKVVTPTPYDMTAMTHNIVLTIGWHTSD